MASVNPLSRELVFKIVYYGPGLGGKTTTLEHIHATAKPEHRGKLVSLATPVDRTLYFDFLPVRLPPVRGMNVRLQLFTVPGQVYFNATRKLVLTGADGVVFVSDSQLVRADANLESIENLRDNLADQGRDITELPLVFAHNKRDLPDLLPLEELNSMLNPFGAPAIATSARLGDGVYETLERICERVLDTFKDKLPDLPEGEIGQSFEAVEGGLITALRDASHRSEPPRDVVVARIGAGGEHPSIPPETPASDPLPFVPAEGHGDRSLSSVAFGVARAAQSAAAKPPQAAPAPVPLPPAPPAPTLTLEPEPALAPEPKPAPAPAPEPPAPASAPVPVVPAAPAAPKLTDDMHLGPVSTRGSRSLGLPAAPAPGPLSPPESPLVGPSSRVGTAPPVGVSFAALWPEGEQDMVREVEEAIARGRYWRAIELCEALVSRVLAGAAGLFATSEAPRDAAIVPMLLGLDGRRYLAFRSVVREARSDGLITAREALAAYAFAIECRIARSSVHH